MTRQVRMYWASRCADCRALLAIDTTGYVVNERLLCADCAAGVHSLGYSDSAARWPKPYDMHNLDLKD